MPFMTWATHVLQWRLTKRSKTARWSKTQKQRLSSDCRLQLACMKSELLVIVDQHATVNTFPGLVHTARHTMRVGNTRSRWPNRKEGAVEGRTSDWGQVVTRYPYENVGMDHLLSKEKDVKQQVVEEVLLPV